RYLERPVRSSRDYAGQDPPSIRYLILARDEDRALQTASLACTSKRLAANRLEKRRIENGNRGGAQGAAACLRRYWRSVVKGMRYEHGWPDLVTGAPGAADAPRGGGAPRRLGPRPQSPERGGRRHPLVADRGERGRNCRHHGGPR